MRSHQDVPQKPEEAHALVDCSVKAHGYKNISMIFHVILPISFHMFKTLIYQWLQVNKLFMMKTIFKSLKDKAVCIGHLTHLIRSVLIMHNTRMILMNLWRR
eukprot:11552986-Ditylum_brightwellii.AAC.1